MTNEQQLISLVKKHTENVDTVLEIGVMFGHWIGLANGRRKIGVEVYAPYLTSARINHPEVEFINSEGMTFLQWKAAGWVDVIMFIDVIEHFERANAITLIKEAKRVCKKRVIAFVPVGIHPQTEDVTGLGGHHWQTHRSTWYPTDFEEMGFDVKYWPEYHNEPGKDKGAMFVHYEKNHRLSQSL